LIVGAGHRFLKLGAAKRPFPLNFFVLSVVNRSIAEPFAATREIHHNHAAGPACRRAAESLTFDASRTPAAVRSAFRK
jgi:hypothetical protein